ncbi:hypothetical protein SAMN02745166_03484 [Prosthecobacter debontii]|uniref:Uncharacterized protein n=1 Tax=Prosthecobacter debontii TaxID=48467 RepID=A0A1T4YKS3_9BACT|nr:hypothetical protein [Prosthecobacter debontii]SKB01855.1 hypothetical protein SAMN02745166_03484 [Prosthecobacter debontii]
MEYTKKIAGFRAMVIAPLAVSYAQFTTAVEPSPATAQRIQLEIFDRPLRNASLSLLELISTKQGNISFEQEAVLRSQSLYMQASRYKQAYGTRGWQERGGEIVEELLESSLRSLENKQASADSLETVKRYRDALRTGSSRTR